MILWLILRLHWRFSTILETSRKSVWSSVFWYVKVCIFWICIQYTIHWDKTQILKKLLTDKINEKKCPLFFFFELQLMAVLLLIYHPYMSWNKRFFSLKLCVGISISIPFHFCESLYFRSTKCMNSLTLKCLNSFQN